MNTSVGVGCGAGGNHGLRRGNNNALRDRRGRYAKNPENGRGGPEGEFAASANCNACEDSLDGEIVIEIGGKLGAGLTVNPFANVSFAFSDPISYDYGIKMGVAGYVGAELYLKASANGSGTLVLK